MALIDFFIYLKLKLFGLIFYYVPLDYLAAVFPQISLERIANITAFRTPKENLPPNFNQVLDIEGIARGKVSWFTRAEDLGPSDPVLIYLHGNFYALGAIPEHSRFLSALWQASKVKKLSIVWLDYTLSTDARFPQQLLEAAAVYKKVSEYTNNIGIIGDSAGGHLAVSLLRHLYKPLSGLPPIETKVRPSAAVLVSPWLDLVTDLNVPSTSSLKKYRWSDIISIHSLNKGGKMIAPKSPELFREVAQYYSDTSVSWSEILPKHTLVTYGSEEVLRDQIEEFVKTSKLIENGGLARVDEGGVHDSPIVGNTVRNPLFADIVGFLNEHL